MARQKDQRLDTLAGIGLFQTSTKAQLKWLVPILTPVKARAGQVLCTEGEPGRACYVVVEGEASVSIGGDAVDTIGPGGFFGEMALLDGGPRVATITATTDMQLFEMTRADFVSVITEVPAIARNMLVAVGERLRAAHAQLHPGSVGI